VTPATNSPPARIQSSARGLRVTWSAGTTTYSACEERQSDQPTTSSPTAKSVTDVPTSTTRPAKSLPCPDGKVAGQRSW
jgi:hypothetical protein